VLRAGRDPAVVNRSQFPSLVVSFRTEPGGDVGRAQPMSDSKQHPGAVESFLYLHAKQGIFAPDEVWHGRCKPSHQQGDGWLSEQ
jgi:hypothetical protein